MARSGQIIVASASLATLIALMWFRAPILPAVVGAAGAGLMLHLRAKRSAL
jgi:hypothetical protein